MKKAGRKEGKDIQHKGETEALPPPAAIFTRRQRLRSIFDCNRLLAKLINRCLTGEMEEARAARITYMIGVLMKGFEIGDLEVRLRKLEDIAEGRT